MTSITLRRDARILVCDGKTALFLRNTGTPGHESFAVERSTRQDLPAHTADMGSDRPGRVGNARTGPTTSIEPADWHAEQEAAFVANATRVFATWCDEQPEAQVLLVAPPRALATIRETASAALLARCVAQIAKDLTKHPVDEIRKLALA